MPAHAMLLLLIFPSLPRASAQDAAVVGASRHTPRRRCCRYATPLIPRRFVTFFPVNVTLPGARAVAVCCYHVTLPPLHIDAARLRVMSSRCAGRRCAAIRQRRARVLRLALRVEARRSSEEMQALCGEASSVLRRASFVAVRADECRRALMLRGMRRYGYIDDFRFVSRDEASAARYDDERMSMPFTLAIRLTDDVYMPICHHVARQRWQSGAPLCCCHVDAAASATMRRRLDADAATFDADD